MSLFPSMVEIIPEGQRGIAKVKHAYVSKFDAIMSSMRGQYLKEGPICQLYIGGIMMMSDGANEHSTNYGVLRNSHGDVLIAGLGIGMILTKILEKPEVSSVLIVEKYQDVIDLISPHFQNPKLKIICADIREWKPAKGVRFDTIYFDIWADQSTDDLEDMATLHRRFRAHKKPGCWMESWNRSYLQSRKRRESRMDW